MATQIKVLLKNDVPSLGTGGEVVRVRPGFARNFLLPRGLAVPATAGNLARVEDLKRQVASLAKQELEAANAAAAGGSDDRWPARDRRLCRWRARPGGGRSAD